MFRGGVPWREKKQLLRMSSTTNTTGRYTLPKAERLAGRSDIGRLFTHGEAFLVYPIKCTYRWTEQGGGVRIMVLVPKRNHKRAVARNLLKRRMREAYRLHKELLAVESVEAGRSVDGVDMAFSYVAKGEPLDYRTVERAMVTILKKMSAQRSAPKTDVP